MVQPKTSGLCCRAAEYACGPVARACAVLGLVLACVSCGQDAVKPITHSRTIDRLPKPASVQTRSAERFGYGPVAPAAAPAPPKQQESPFSWAVPEGWVQAPDRPMREATFMAGPKVECYVSVFGQAAGDVEANVNRWRAQMGQEPLSRDAIGALPSVNVLGKTSPMVEIQGTYTPMGGEPIQDALFYGVLCVLDDAAVFIKMTGPAEAMRSQKDHFIAFCESLRREKP